MDKQRTSWTTHTTDGAQPKSAAGKPQETPAPTGWMYNRTLAAVVLAVTVVCSVAFGVNKGVQTAYRDVTEAYAMGLDGSGYGVAYYANGMQEHAANLCKIAEKTRYESVLDTDNVRTAITAARNAETAGETFDALNTLIDEVDALNLEMQESGLEAGDETFRAGEHQNFTDQFYKLRNVAVDYNEVAREYNDKTLGGSLVGMFRRLLRFPTAEEFS